MTSTWNLEERDKYTYLHIKPCRNVSVLDCLCLKQNSRNRKGTICLNFHQSSTKENMQVAFTEDGF